MKLRILSAPAFLLALFAVACSRQTDTPRVYTATPGATAHGPYPRGTVTAATLLDLTKRGPRLTVLAPDRGAQIASATAVTVKVQATSVNQVVQVTIGGTSAAMVANNVFEATVALTPGTNFIHTVALDSLGQKGESTFSVVQGVFQPMDQLLASPIAASLSTSGLARIEPLIDTAVATIDLQALLLKANPLENAAGLVTVDALAFTYAPPKTTITGTATGGQVAIELDHVLLTVQADALGLPITQGQVSADSGTATFQVAVNRTPAFLAAHPLGLEVTCTGLTFQNLFLSSPVPAVTLILQGVEPAILSPLTNVVTQALTSAVQGLLDKAQLAGITQPLVAQIPTLGGTAPVDFELQPSQIQGVLGQGLAVALDAKATAPQPFSPSATTQVLVSGVQLPLAIVPSSDFACLISVDAANAFLQAYWLAGGTSLRLDGAAQPSTFLTARVLYPFLPQVREIAPDGDTPLVVEVSSASPPLATFGGAANPVAITVGEAEIRILLDFQDGQPRLELFTLRVPFELTATVTVQNGAIVIANLQAPVVSVDVLREPVTPLDDLAITNFLAQLLPFLLDQFRQQIPPITIPALPLGLSLSNAGIAPEPGYVEVWGDF